MTQNRIFRFVVPAALLLFVTAVPLFAASAATTAPHGITATLAFYAERAIHAIGYPGVFLAMTAESMFLPMPSEAVMPFTGFLVADGVFSLPVVLVVAVLGSIVGSLISYFIGAWGGRPFVNKFGKYVLLDQRDLDATERFFNRRGEAAIFVSRFIPVVRHLISLPAGAARMNLWKFSVFTILGAGLWDAFLAVAGFYLKDHWSRIMHYSHLIDAVVVVLLLALIVWYVYRHIRRLAIDRRLSVGDSSQ